MLIADEDSWKGNSDGDNDEDDGQYEQMGDDKQVEYDEEAEDEPPDGIQQSTQEHDNAETECDDVTTEDESKQGEDYEGQFNDTDFEGIMFVQNHVVCNMQEKAGIQKTWILLDSQSY